MKLSIIVPTLNEEKSILKLIKRIHSTVTNITSSYEIICVDDNSSDKTQRIVNKLSSSYPVTLYIKIGKKGKAESLIEGFKYAKYPILAMIDADLQYPPEALSAMLKKIQAGADVVIAERKTQKNNSIRKFLSKSYYLLFGKLLHGFNVDIQSGLKVFRKEIIERTTIHASSWAFDLEFLIHARDAGYIVDTVNIDFEKRKTGKSKIRFLQTAFELGINAVLLKFKSRRIIPFSTKTINKNGQGFHHKGLKFIPYTTLTGDQTAFFQVTKTQLSILLFLASLLFAGLLISWHTTIVVILSLLTFLYFSDLLFNFYLIFRSFSQTPEIQVTKDEISNFKNSWPSYSIFCPLYKEWQVVPQFISAMESLNYPKAKLQVMLILEEDDRESIEKIEAFNLPEYFKIIIVPHSLPKTKPKACNYALQFATGEYSVIYDAEDIPDPLQLKKVILAFKKADKNVACMQCKLNFYNPQQNLLTKIFTAEYSLWFDLVLTGLQSINAPIPLGGTSNHFKTNDLKSFKGWDAFNVTEDCDLGIRLVKQGYKTAILDSTTLEEANSDYLNWFWQRTRWIKGYIQTYLVHMRNPKELMTGLRKSHLITFQLVVGGKILSMFINPIMWGITISYFMFRPIIGEFIESFFPDPILYMGVFSLIFGNFLYVYYYMIGCAKRGHYDIIKYAFLVPFYWLAMSIAATIALYEIVQRPHKWSKTKHGLHLKYSHSLKQSAATIGRELVHKEYKEKITPQNIPVITTNIASRSYQFMKFTKVKNLNFFIKNFNKAN